MVTGGFAPNIEGWAKPFAGTSRPPARAATESSPMPCTPRGGKIALQILHPAATATTHCRGASRIQAPISPFTPASFGARHRTPDPIAFVRCAVLAREAGYDGVEVMGSEGYLHQPVPRPPTPTSAGRGGRRLFETACACRWRSSRMREAVGPDFILIYRLSMLDLIPDGSSWRSGDARQGDREGRRHDHQHRHRLARGAHPHHRHQRAARRLCLGDQEDARDAARRGHHGAAGHQQPHQHARGGRADPRRRLRRHGERWRARCWPTRLRAQGARGRAAINTCIACNQACLDHIFQLKIASCLVNPRAATRPSCCCPAPLAKKRYRRGRRRPGRGSRLTTLAERGHEVNHLRSGQRHRRPVQPKRIPGKEEFLETLRYFAQRIAAAAGVHAAPEHARRCGRPGGFVSTPCCWPPA